MRTREAFPVSNGMEVLSKLFGGRLQIKIMRLFLLNPGRVYETKQVMVASRGKRRNVLRELSAYKNAGLVRRKGFYKDVGKKKVRAFGWVLNASFIYLTQLRNLLISSILITRKDILKRLARGGNLKLVVLSGIFIQEWDSRVDILVVGEKLKKGLLGRIIRSLESEIGRELRYSMLEVPEFQYRLSIGDKLVRDIFDFPHQIILDKIGLKAEE